MPIKGPMWGAHRSKTDFVFLFFLLFGGSSAVSSSLQETRARLGPFVAAAMLAARAGMQPYICFQ